MFHVQCRRLCMYVVHSQIPSSDSNLCPMFTYGCTVHTVQYVCTSTICTILYCNVYVQFVCAVFVHLQHFLLKFFLTVLSLG